MGGCDEQSRLRRVAPPLTPFTINESKKYPEFAILPLTTRGKVDCLLPHNHPERVLVSSHIIIINASEGKQIAVVAQPAGVVQELKNRDLPASLRRITAEETEASLSPQPTPATQFLDSSLTNPVMEG
jgi:hypothetical protein